MQTLRDSAYYATGYLRGHDTSITGMYGSLISKITSILTVPLPLLSFLALPLFGGQTTSINFVLFYLTWSTLVLTNNPLKIELYGTLIVRLFAFVLPGLVSLGVDLLVPSLARSAKARGQKQMPGKLQSDNLVRIAGWSVFNVLLGVALQSMIEIVLTKVLNARSSLAVSTLVPLPWTIAKHMLSAYVLRGLLHYYIHRYVLHSQARTKLSTWHKTWAHSSPFTFTLHAAYDHPACYLLAHWLPTYLPAIYLRMHVLTWLLFLTLTSLEAAFIYSGYAVSVLPSAILVPSMARRIDAHFFTRGKGNYGQLGVMDWVCDTSCATPEADFGDDVHEEAEKHNVRRRVSDAVDDAKGAVGDARRRFGRNSMRMSKDDDANNDDAIQEEDEAAEQTPRRRTGRAKAGKA